MIALGVAISASTTKGNGLSAERLAHHKSLAAKTPRFAQGTANAEESPLNRELAPAFTDVKLNNDNNSSTLTQRYSDIAHFSDGRGVIVWEDERNGVWKIYAQPLGLGGAAVGANRLLDSSNPPASLRHPCVAANAAGIVVIAYVNETTGGLFTRTYDFGLTSGGGETRVDDPVAGNAVGFPAIAVLSGGRFVLVWEDSRAGANIYAQILNSDGTKSGDNFVVNGAADSPYRIAPAVASSLNGDFAVVWEDGRSNNGDVYFRLFTDVGTPLFGELPLDLDHASDFQFMPKVEFLRGNAYFATWISDRDGGQSIYAQLMSTSSAPLGDDFRLNDAIEDLCWEPLLAPTSDSGVVCIWAEYSMTASIELQKISKTGALSGPSQKIEDVGLLRERGFPSIAQNSSGLTAAWVDERNDNLDIYAQRLNLALAKSGDNYKINDDVNGAQQLTPTLVGVTPAIITAAWHDRRDDQGDIYVQSINANGNLYGSQIRINDDAGRGVQSNPAIAASPTGAVWVVWEDTRHTAAGGQNIFAQRLDGNNNKLGVNFIVNDDATSQPMSQPDVDAALNGVAVATWVDERDAGKEIYAQEFSAAGAPVGTNVRVSNLPASAENFEPHIGLRADMSRVIAWKSIFGSRETVFFQRFAANGAMLGAAQMIDADTTQTQIEDFDLFVHRTSGYIFISTIEVTFGERNIITYVYDHNGALAESPIVVSDQAGDYSDLRLAGDVSDGLIVTWITTSNGASRGHLQLLRADGFALGSNQPISASASNRQESAPVATMIGGYYYCAWADSRNANAGFDILINSLQYTQTDADDDDYAVLPRVFALEQNYPNPFNPETVISYSLDKPGQVELVIYNVVGQKVATLVDALESAGPHAVRWNAASGGQALASGVYFYRLTVDGSAMTRKMTLLK